MVNRVGSVISGTFAGANLSGADLRGADIRDADLSDAVLDGVKLANAKVVGAILTPVHKQLVQMSQAGRAAARPPIAKTNPNRAWCKLWS